MECVGTKGWSEGVDDGCLVSWHEHCQTPFHSSVQCGPANRSVPISKLPRLIRETSEDFEKRGLTACHFG